MSRQEWTIELIGTEGQRKSAIAQYPYYLVGGQRFFAYMADVKRFSDELKQKSISHQIVDPSGYVRQVFEGE